MKKRSLPLILTFLLFAIPASAEKPATAPETILTPELIEKVKEFHGHSCPGSYIGLRAADWAAREFGTDADGKLVIVVEVPFCGVDSLQVVLGCTVGSGNLIVKDYGKHAINFYRPGDGKKARLLWKMKESPEYREKRRTLDPKDRQGRNRLLQDYILSAPFEDLFVVTVPKEAMPDTSRGKQDVPCSVCGEDVDTTRIKIKDGKQICPACLKDQ